MRISADLFQSRLLYLMVVLCFIRASNIGFGYPVTEDSLGGASFLLQKITQMVILTLLIIYIFFFHQSILKIHLSRVSWSIVICILSSILLSDFVSLSLRFLLSFVVLSLPIILMYLCLGKEKLYKLSYIVFIVIFYLSLFYMLVFPQYGIMAGKHYGAFRGLFLHKNVFGFFCVMISLYSLNELTLTTNKRLKYFSIVTIVLALICVLNTKSTTSVLLTGLSFIVFYYYVFLNGFFGSNTSKVLFYYAFLVLVFFLTMVFSVYYEEIVLMLGKDPTLTGRTELWETLFYIGLDRPIFGHGFGLFYRPEIMYQFSIEFGWAAKSTHNSYLDLWLCLGGLGLVSIIFYMIRILIRFPFNKSHYSIFTATSVLICLCYGGSESGVFLGMNFSWVYLLTAILIGKSTVKRV